MLVTCHYGMVMTNWGNPTISDESNTVFASNNASFGIKIAIQYFSFLIYLLS